MMELSDIERNYDLADMVPGLKGNGRSYWGICPLPQHVHSSHPTPSFSVFWYKGKQRFKCHGNCGLMGNVIDLAGYMWVPNYERYDKKQYLRAAEILTNGAFSPAVIAR